VHSASFDWRKIILVASQFILRFHAASVICGEVHDQLNVKRLRPGRREPAAPQKMSRAREELPIGQRCGPFATD
jgi:hypothetical protein